MAIGDSVKFTAKDCAIFDQVPTRILWNELAPSVEEGMRLVRGKLTSLLKDASERHQGRVPLKPFISLLNPNGRTPPDYWGCLYPRAVANKSYGLESAVIISSSGAELCFCVGAGTSQVRNLVSAATNSAQMRRMQERLAQIPQDIVDGVEAKLGSIWFLRKHWRQQPGTFDFPDLVSWIRYAASAKGNEACVSRTFDPSELEQLGDGILAEYLKATAIFDPIMDWVYRENGAVTESVRDPVREPGRLSETRHEEFRKLFREFIETYLDTPAGQKHLHAYDKARAEARSGWAAVEQVREEHGDSTNLVLSKLLPHMDTPTNRARGAWYHPAQAINGDVRTWFESVGHARSDDWPLIADAIAEFVANAIADPTNVQEACDTFSEKGLKGFQSGMLSPILSALRPDSFFIINGKSRALIKWIDGTSIERGLTEYPEANSKAAALVVELEPEMRHPETTGSAMSDLFDMFGHWLTAIHRIPGEGITVIEDPIDGPSKRVREKQYSNQYWCIAAGEGGFLWPQLIERSEIAIGARGLSDLRRLGSYDLIFDALDNRAGGDASPTNEALCCDEFLNEMHIGDFVLVKRGRSEIVGYGRIASDYIYDENLAPYAHRRKVEWLSTGTWRVTPNSLPVKALTNVTEDSSLLEEILAKVKEERVDPPQPTAPLYTIDDATKDVFMTKDRFAEILGTLGRKKNIILEGPPGVGKTFVARRLAYALIGYKDPSREDASSSINRILTKISCKDGARPPAAGSSCGTAYSMTSACAHKRIHRKSLC